MNCTYLLFCLDIHSTCNTYFDTEYFNILISVSACYAYEYEHDINSRGYRLQAMTLRFDRLRTRLYPSTISLEKSIYKNTCSTEKIIKNTTVERVYDTLVSIK